MALNVDKAIDWGLGLGVLFLLASSFVLPQFSTAITAAAGITDNNTKTLVTTALGIGLIIAFIYVLKSSAGSGK
jgi:hypothetical protein